MTEYRIHYRIFQTPHCGHPSAKNFTTVPAKVTCENCKKLMTKELQS